MGSVDDQHEQAHKALMLLRKATLATKVLHLELLLQHHQETCDELAQLRSEREAPHGMVEADVVRWLTERGYTVTKDT